MGSDGEGDKGEKGWKEGRGEEHEDHPQIKPKPVPDQFRLPACV